MILGPSRPCDSLSVLLIHGTWISLLSRICIFLTSKNDPSPPLTHNYYVTVRRWSIPSKLGVNTKYGNQSLSQNLQKLISELSKQLEIWMDTWSPLLKWAGPSIHCIGPNLVRISPGARTGETHYVGPSSMDRLDQTTKAWACVSLPSPEVVVEVEVGGPICMSRAS